MPHFKIDTTGKYGVKVVMNGEELKDLRAFSFHAEAGHVCVARMEMFAHRGSTLEFDAECQVHVIAPKGCSILADKDPATGRQTMKVFEDE